jgi:hypothetical protein
MHLERDILKMILGYDKHWIPLEDLRNLINKKIIFTISSSDSKYVATMQIEGFDIENKNIIIINESTILGIIAIDQWDVIYQCKFFINNGKINRLIIEDPHYDKYTNRYRQEFQL